MSDKARKLATSCISIQNAVAANDLLDEKKTQTDLVALILRMGAGPGAGGLGFKCLATSINSDHDDDTALGLSVEQIAAGVKNHGHTNGFAIDIGAIDGTDVGGNNTTLTFCLAMGQSNHWVTKIGLGGTARQFLAQLTAACPGTVVFADNDQNHVHLQTD